MKQKQSSKTRRQIQSADERSIEEAPATNPSARTSMITDAEVALRAYEEFESCGGQHGNDVAHWLNAESRIAAEQSF